MFRKLTYDFPKKILGNLNLLTSEKLRKYLRQTWEKLKNILRFFKNRAPETVLPIPTTSS